MRVARRSGLQRLLPGYASAPLTYAEVGATRGPLPAGYHHVQRRSRLGDDGKTFDLAADAVRSWEMHRRSGLAVATDGPAEDHRTVVLGLGRPWSLVVPCRVVYVVDDADRCGFAYGTLADHPERGEEAFVVSRDIHGVSWLEITAFSRGATPLVQWGAAFGHAVQAVATRRYETALRAVVADA